MPQNTLHNFCYKTNIIDQNTSKHKFRKHLNTFYCLFLSLGQAVDVFLELRQHNGPLQRVTENFSSTIRSLSAPLGASALEECPGEGYDVGSS